MLPLLFAVGALLAFIVGVLRFLKAQGGRGGGDGDDEQPQVGPSSGNTAPIAAHPRPRCSSCFGCRPDPRMGPLQHLGVGVPARGLNRPGALRRRRRAAAAAAAAAEDAGVEGDDDEVRLMRCCRLYVRGAHSGCRLLDALWRLRLGCR